MRREAEYAFADVMGDGDQTALLLDHRGEVRAGLYLDSRGVDVTAEIGRALGADRKSVV